MRVCITCGATARETHHVGSRKLSTLTVPVCVECHRALSLWQSERWASACPCDTRTEVFFGTLDVLRLAAVRTGSDMLASLVSGVAGTARPLSGIPDPVASAADDTSVSPRVMDDDTRDACVGEVCSLISGADRVLRCESGRDSPGAVDPRKLLAALGRDSGTTFTAVRSLCTMSLALQWKAEHVTDVDTDAMFDAARRPLLEIVARATAGTGDSHV